MLLLAPLVPVVNADPREYSWALMLHHGFAQGMDFGKVLVFTYGPWGFLLEGYHPETFVAFALSSGVIAAAVVAALWSLVTRPDSGLVSSLFLLAIAVAFVAFWRSQPTYLLLPSLTYLAVRDQRSSEVVRVFLIVALALASLTKFPVLVLASVAVAGLGLERLAARRVPREALFFAACVALFWLIARQPLSSFLPYVQNSLALASGYADAMQLPAPRLHDPLAPFVVSMVLFWLGASGIEFRRGRVAGIVFAATVGAMLALYFKGASVRPGYPHTTPAYLTLAVLQITYLASIRHQMRIRRSWESAPLLATAASLVIVLAVCVGFPHGGAMRYLLAQPRTLVERTVELSRPRELRESLDLMFRERMEGLRAGWPLPPLEGPADAIPSLQSVLLAHGEPVVPRPLFESYTAYAASLASLNVDHYQSGGAAHTLLFDIAPIDGRFPSLDDGASWPEIASRYELASETPNFLILEKRIEPQELSMRVIAEGTGRLGEALTIPHSTRPLFVSLEIAPTLAGSIQRLFYRTSPLRIRVRTGGEETSWRIIRGNAASGFLIAPLVTTRNEFATFLSGEPGGRRPESFAIEGDGSDWNREYRFVFRELWIVENRSRLRTAHTQLGHQPDRQDERCGSAYGI